MAWCWTLLSLLAILPYTSADTPANCSYADIQGRWNITESSRGHDNSISGCNASSTAYIYMRTVTLMFPDVAADEYGNKGFWTLIYNQGFEVVITGRKFFFFSDYDSTKSYCHQTKEGWSHTEGGMDWACAKGQKLDDVVTDVGLQQAPSVFYKNNVLRFYTNIAADKSKKYTPNPDFVDSINKAQSSWKAKHYSGYESMTLNDMHLRAGGPKSKIAGIPEPRSPNLGYEEKKKLLSLPESFDWRNVHGESFVTPVRNQGSCGSCYAFSSMGMNEARLRVMTNNTQSAVFSTQDIVECCPYSQGCAGGFPYLVGGKYAADFGMVQENCNPYKGVDGQCSTDPSCKYKRRYGFHYKYVGGYYGACNEEEMKLALMRGPFSVSFEVYPDFQLYHGGVYHHVEGLLDKFNPFEITNHAVLLVGWGVDQSAGPYWIVKNSWGISWGESGYFRIRRGTDECSIESLGVESFPVI